MMQKASSNYSYLVRSPFLLDYSFSPILCKFCGKPIKSSDAFGLGSFHDQKSFCCQKCCEMLDSPFKDGHKVCIKNFGRTNL